MSVRSRLPSVLLLGAALLASGLLVVGYGVAVGIGVIVGLVLGWMVIVAVLAMSHRSGSSVTFLAQDRRVGEPDGADMAQMESFGRDSMRVAGVDAGVLRRVIALGDEVEASGARVELIAIEIREDGGIATLAAHVRPPVGTLGHFADVAVSDDADTAYVAIGIGIGGSFPGSSRHEIRFAPAPPDAAQTLTLRIEGFMDPFPGPTVQLRGTWEFRVALRASSAP
jgi:hypothetical protein